ncbi:HNH endonuclease [Bacillus thuringiensis]
MTNFYKSTRWKNKRLRILKCDLHQCQECKRYGRNEEATTVHHINPLRMYPEIRLESWNLVSLCGNCHEKMHDRQSDTLTDLGKQWQDRVKLKYRK